MANVCVFCSSSAAVEDRFGPLAQELGQALARRGHTLVSGGGSVSLMGRVARGARGAGGHTVGVIPEHLKSAEVTDADADDLHVTPTMHARLALMVSMSDVFVVLPGGIGTLQELFDVWVDRVLGVHDKPAVICDPEGVFGPLREALAGLVDAGLIRASAMESLTWTGSVAQTMEWLDAAVPPPVGVTP